jgi:hypothetical protein
MKIISAKNSEEKSDFSSSLRPYGLSNSRYLFATHIAHTEQDKIGSRQYENYYLILVIALRFAFFRSGRPIKELIYDLERD